MRCRDAGNSISPVSRTGTSPLVVNTAGLEVYWVPSGPDDAVAFEKFAPLDWPAVLRRLEQRDWTQHSPVDVWWNGITGDLERWDWAAAQTARELGSEWTPLQLVFPLLQAWMGNPVVCAACDGGNTDCIDCCSSQAPARNCSEKFGAAVPRSGWWRLNASHQILHRCAHRPAACLGGPETSCAVGFSGPLCAGCAPTHAVDPEDGCSVCPPQTVALLGVLVRAGLLVALTLAMMRLSLKAQPPPAAPTTQAEKENGGRDVLRRYQDVHEQIEGSERSSSARSELLLVSLRTLAGFMQVQTLVLCIPLPWPRSFSSLGRFLGSATAASNVAAPLQCLISQQASMGSAVDTAETDVEQAVRQSRACLHARTDTPTLKHSHRTRSVCSGERTHSSQRCSHR